MNSEQLSGISKPLISALAMYLASSHILFDNNTWSTILASLVAIGLAIWSYRQNTVNNQVRIVDEMARNPGNPVKAIIVDNTKAGADMANSMPGMNTVVEGTKAARSASENASSEVQAP